MRCGRRVLLCGLLRTTLRMGSGRRCENCHAKECAPPAMGGERACCCHCLSSPTTNPSLTQRDSIQKERKDGHQEGRAQARHERQRAKEAIDTKYRLCKTRRE